MKFYSMLVILSLASFVNIYAGPTAQGESYANDQAEMSWASSSETVTEFNQKLDDSIKRGTTPLLPGAVIKTQIDYDFLKNVSEEKCKKFPTKKEYDEDPDAYNRIFSKGIKAAHWPESFMPENNLKGCKSISHDEIDCGDKGIFKKKINTDAPSVGVDNKGRGEMEKSHYNSGEDRSNTASTKRN